MCIRTSVSSRHQIMCCVEMLVALDAGLASKEIQLLSTGIQMVQKDYMWCVAHMQTGTVDVV